MLSWNMLEALYIALPAFVANMIPVIVARLNILPSFATAIDEPLFGANKTWRGLLLGIAVACVVALVQFFVFAPHFENIVHSLFFGFLAGSGALLGDLAKSFIKRRIGIESGRPFVPFDQIDYILGFLLATSLLYSWSGEDVAVLVIFALVANPLINALGYVFGIKKTFW